VSRGLLIVRPEPGASMTAGRARARGWKPLVAPLFEVVALAWDAPDPARFDAVLLTSANALRHGGVGLITFTRLPAYAVGSATADAAREAGFDEVIEGGGDVEASVALLRAEARHAIVHLAGRDARGFDEQGLDVTWVAVYAAQEVAPDDFGALLDDAAVTLIHSPRAGEALARRVGARRNRIGIAAISARALRAAGEGWRASAVAARPTDEALLDAAETIAR